MRDKSRFILQILSFFLLVSCSSQATTSTPLPRETTSSITSQVPSTPTRIQDETLSTPGVPVNHEIDSLSGVRISFWHPWRGETASVIEDLTAEFNSENSFQIEVFVQGQGSNYFEVVRQGLNTGQFPNLVLGTTHSLLAWEQSRDIFVDLNEYIYDPDHGLSESEIHDFQPLLWKQDISNSIRLGVPSLAFSTLFVYNESWAKELGFDSAPNTPESFTTQACAAAVASVNSDGIYGTGALISSLDPSGMMSWIMAFDDDFSDGMEETGGDYDLSNKDMEDAFDYVKFLFDGGCARDPGIPYVEDQFATRKGIFYATTVLDLPYIEAAFTEDEEKDSWRVIPYPTENGNGMINLIPYSYAILRTAPEEQLAAWYYLMWMIAPENLAAVVEASSAYPSRISAMNFLTEYKESHPQWAEAQELFALGSVEPRLSAWHYNRWAVRDAMEELISPDFNSVEIPNLLEKLETILIEIQLEDQ